MNPNLPSEFIDMLRSLGNAAYEALPEVIAAGDCPVSVRHNPRKGQAPDDGDAVPWCATGRWLPRRPAFTLDPALHQGLYYVQDASSMAISAAVARALEVTGRSGEPVRYLDACAAPGGKTTAAADVLPSGSFVVANEFDPRRASILAENVAKWGIPAIVTRGDASQLRGLDGFFDIVAADVPCSGEGMMRKEPKAIEQWSPGLITQCAARQRDIVDALWRALRPGGAFIYSTCTFNTAENEEIVQHLVEDFGAIPTEIPTLMRPEIIGAAKGFDTLPVYRFVPGKVRGEGQFIALLVKPGEAKATTPRIKPPKTKPLSGIDVLEGRWQYNTVGDDGAVFAIPAQWSAELPAVAAATHIVAGGTHVGNIKGRDFIPAQPLAMSLAIKAKAFPTAEVDTATALDYLRRLTVAPPEGAPRGYVLLTHGGHPLGFIKNIGNRTNNLYPQQWRILN